MKISRRNFIRRGGAAAFAGAALLLPVSAAPQKTQGGSGAFSPAAAAAADPLLYLTSDDFKRCAGTQFLLLTEIGTTTAVLSSVTQIIARRGPRNPRQQAPPETFSLSFRLPTAAEEGWPQATYGLRHPRLGEFDLFLVPEASSDISLYAVINRI